MSRSVKLKKGRCDSTSRGTLAGRRKPKLLCRSPVGGISNEGQNFSNIKVFSSDGGGIPRYLTIMGRSISFPLYIFERIAWQ